MDIRRAADAAEERDAMSLELGSAPKQEPHVYYRGTFGWPVRWHRTGVNLVTGSGIGAVVVPRRMSDLVLASLERQGCPGPALALLTRRERITVLLVDADDVAMSDTPLPADVRVLPAGSAVPLPDERDPHGLAHWLVAPEESQRWLPSLSAVLTTIASTSAMYRELIAR